MCQPSAGGGWVSNLLEFCRSAISFRWMGQLSAGGGGGDKPKAGGGVGKPSDGGGVGQPSDGGGVGHPSAGAGVGQKPAGGRSGHLSSGCGKSAFSWRWMGQLSAGIRASQPSVGGGVGQLRARGGRISHQLEVGPNQICHQLYTSWTQIDKASASTLT